MQYHIYTVVNDNPFEGWFEYRIKFTDGKVVGIQKYRNWRRKIMNKTQSESRMLAYLVKNKLGEKIPEIIECYEKEHNHKFTKKEWKELLAFGEEIIEMHFPESSYTFTIKEEELAEFDKFIEEFVYSFLGVFVCAMSAHMNLTLVMSRIDNSLPDQD